MFRITGEIKKKMISFVKSLKYLYMLKCESESADIDRKRLLKLDHVSSPKVLYVYSVIIYI